MLSDLNMDYLEHTAEEQPQLTTALFTLSGVLREVRDTYAEDDHREFTVTIADSVLDLIPYGELAKPIGPIEQTGYQLYLMTTSNEHCYVIVPRERRVVLGVLLAQ